METQWFRQDKPAVLDALRHGQRPLMATTTASGPWDELIALHPELGVFDALDQLPVGRQRAGIDDELLYRHRHPEGRQAESLPCHPDTLRDAFRRVEAVAWQRVQRAGAASLYQRQLVRGQVYAIDGSGLNNEFRLVSLVCVSSQRPVIVAWRLRCWKGPLRRRAARPRRLAS